MQGFLLACLRSKQLGVSSIKMQFSGEKIKLRKDLVKLHLTLASVEMYDFFIFVHGDMCDE